MKFDLGSIEHRLATNRVQEPETGEQCLRRIEAALQRLDSGQFGYCESCGSPIAMARLRADPTVSRCRSCASGEDEDEG